MFLWDLALFGGTLPVRQSSNWELLCFGSGVPAIWLWAGGLMLAVTLVAALLMGGLLGRWSGRNLWPAAVRVASSLSGFLLLSLLTWGSVVLGAVRLIMRSGNMWLGGRMGAWIVFLGSILLPPIVALTAYFVLVYRETAAARHANR
jgi:hypothetical protein